VKEGEEKGE